MDDKIEIPVKGHAAWGSIILSFVGKALWPLFAILVLLSFWNSLHVAAGKLPDLLDRATQVRFGSLSVALKDQSRIQTSPEVQVASKSMSNIALRRIMQLTQAGGGLSNCVIGNERSGFEDYASADKELEKRGLVVQTLSPEQNRGTYSDCYVVKPTDLGRQTQDFLTSLLVLGVSPSNNT